MKLSKWAKEQGITYKTAWRMWKAGKLPVPAEQLPTGTVILHPKQAFSPGGVALYARVSSADQKNDLDRQLARLSEYAASQHMLVTDAVREIGSGLNARRRGLLRLLANPAVHAIVVEHRDRLMRFGFEYVESALAAQGRKIVVLEADESTDDIVRDLHEVIVSMCARLYGKRAATNRARKAIEAMQCSS
jgi:predicted site-specific integrase-resolvase